MRQITKTFKTIGKSTANNQLAKWLNYHRNYSVISCDRTEDLITVICEIKEEKEHGKK